MMVSVVRAMCGAAGLQLAWGAVALLSLLAMVVSWLPQSLDFRSPVYMLSPALQQYLLCPPSPQTGIVLNRPSLRGDDSDKPTPPPIAGQVSEGYGEEESCPG